MRIERETILRALIGSFLERVKPELQSAAARTAPTERAVSAGSCAAGQPPEVRSILKSL